MESHKRDHIFSAVILLFSNVQEHHVFYAQIENPHVLRHQRFLFPMYKKIMFLEIIKKSIYIYIYIYILRHRRFLVSVNVSKGKENNTRFPSGVQKGRIQS